MKNCVDDRNQNENEKNLSDIFNELNQIRETQRQGAFYHTKSRARKEHEKVYRMKRVSSSLHKKRFRQLLPTVEEGKLKISSGSLFLFLIVLLIVAIVLTNTSSAMASSKSVQDMQYGSAQVENTIQTQEANTKIANETIETIATTNAIENQSNYAPDLEVTDILNLVNEVQNQEEKLEDPDTQIFEMNENTLDVMQIIDENSSVVKKQEVAIEEREVDFAVTYQDNASLPKGEEKIIQEGVKGKEEVNVIRTYENDSIVDEKVVKTTPLMDYVEQIVEVGTSEFLAKHQVHINDILYVTDNTELKESGRDDGITKTTITKSLDVKLLEVSEDWCKVLFDGTEGFVKSENLTSASSTPSVIEENRIQRIKQKVSFDMELNQPSGLTLDDFKKVLSGDSRDKNKIFESNAEVFYQLEEKYQINGLFVASVGVHESAWGTSRISMDKKNLFGYGAYDSSPYTSAYTFETYQEGIELVAKSFVKYYINPAGTPIYDGEVAKASYYNGPTLSGINVRYASDTEWANKVFKTMKSFYDKL